MSNWVVNAGVKIGVGGWMGQGMLGLVTLFGVNGKPFSEHNCRYCEMVDNGKSCY